MFLNCRRYKTQQFEIIDKLIKEFEDKTNLLIARSLNDKIDDVVWVRVLNTTLDHRKIYKMQNRVGFLWHLISESGAE